MTGNEMSHTDSQVVGRMSAAQGTPKTSEKEKAHRVHRLQ